MDEQQRHPNNFQNLDQFKHTLTLLASSPHRKPKFVETEDEYARLEIEEKVLFDGV